MYFGGNRAGMKTILVKPLSEKKDYKKYIDEKGEIWKEKL